MAPLITSPPRSAVIPDQFGGTPPPSAPASASPEPAPTGDPGAPAAPRGDPPIIQVGASIPIVDGPAALGAITVVQYRSEAVASGGSRLIVEVRYRSEQIFAVRPGAWFAVPLDGELAIAQPAAVEPVLRSITLEAGQSVTGWLAFNLAPDTLDLFLDYLDPTGSTLFSVGLF